jgi:hypothetical protein
MQARLDDLVEKYLEHTGLSFDALEDDDPATLYSAVIWSSLTATGGPGTASVEMDWQSRGSGLD